MVPASSASTFLRTVALAAVVSIVWLVSSQNIQAQGVPDTASARAEALFAAKDYVGAASAFQALTRTHPQQPRYWTRLGTSFQLAGRMDDAVAAYRRAIGITTAPVAMYNLAARVSTATTRTRSSGSSSGRTSTAG